MTPLEVRVAPLEAELLRPRRTGTFRPRTVLMASMRGGKSSRPVLVRQEPVPSKPSALKHCCLSRGGLTEGRRPAQSREAARLVTRVPGWRRSIVRRPSRMRGAATARWRQPPPRAARRPAGGTSGTRRPRPLLGWLAPIQTYFFWLHRRQQDLHRHPLPRWQCSSSSWGLGCPLFLAVATSLLLESLPMPRSFAGSVLQWRLVLLGTLLPLARLRCQLLAPRPSSTCRAPLLHRMAP